MSVDQRPTTPSASPSVPRSVELAIRTVWVLVLEMAVLTVLLWVFRDDVIGDWASGHQGAREVFGQGGREALERHRCRRLGGHQKPSAR